MTTPNEHAREAERLLVDAADVWAGEHRQFSDPDPVAAGALAQMATAHALLATCQSHPTSGEDPYVA